MTKGCRKGKGCGDSCIARDKQCHKLSSPIGLIVKVQVRGTECYVAWGSELERAFVSAMLELVEACLEQGVGPFAVGVLLSSVSLFPHVFHGALLWGNAGTRNWRTRDS